MSVEPPSSAEEAEPGSGREGVLLASTFRAVVEQQAELVSLAYQDGTLVYANPAYGAHFGHRPAALVGTSLFDHVQAPDRAAVRERLRHVVDSGEVLQSENRMRAADGSQRWVRWTNSRLLVTGQAALLQSVGQDITQRIAAEGALRSSRSLLERSGRVAGVGGWTLELDTGEVTWSEQTRRIHEVADDFVPTLENAIGFYSPEARAAIDEAVQVGIERGLPWDLELPLITARGRRIWVRAVGEAETAAGKPVRLLGAFQDITDRRHLEQQVAERERFLRQITDSLPVRIAYVDRERRYRFANPELLRYLGHPLEDVLGRTRAQLMPEADDSLLAERAQAALAGEAQQFEFEELLAGQVRRIENRIIPDRAAGGEVRGFVVTGVDITQRSVAEKAAQDLASILENSTDFVVQTNWQGGLLYMNRAARQALGIGVDTPLHRHHFGEFNTPATNARFAAEILPAVKQHGVWLGETTVYLQGQRVVPVSHMVVAHRGPMGASTGFRPSCGT